MERFGYGIGQVDQDDIQQPGCPNLHFDRILCTAPEIGQTQQALDDIVGIFNAPTLPVQGNPIRRGQLLNF